MIPVIKMLLTYDCISGIPWGSSVFLAVPGSTFLSSSSGFFDFCLFSSSPFSFSLLHCSHNMSWQWCHAYHPHLSFFIPTFICIMTQLFLLETSNICFIFLDLFLILLMLLFLILQVPTISLLVPILSTMVAPSFEEVSFVPLLDVSVLMVTTLHIQGHSIFRPAMFHLELQVALLKPFLDFIHGYQC